jgi:hypothetical protein
MALWDAKGWIKCSKCGTTRLDTELSEGACVQQEWCNKQRVIPEALAKEWVSIQDDLMKMGCAGFEANGNKYVLYGIGETATSLSERLEDDDE